jgi:hypothetical protein
MNHVRDTEILPAITRGHLDFFGRFNRLDTIDDIRKPSDGVWEFSITMKDGCHAVIFLTEDARQVGCCYQEVLPGRVPQGEIRKVKYVAIRVPDFNQWLGFPKQREVTEDKYGFTSIGSREHGLLPDLRRWVIEAVANRVHGRIGCDHYGRVWPEGTKQCPICGQPEFDEDCDHTKLPDARISELRNYNNRYDRVSA